MPNGSVASFLHSSGSGEHKPAISWSSRMNIIVGITRGLVYLHTHENLIIHGNLTSSNVLLDKEYNPLISDVGLSRLSADAKVPNLYNHAPELFELKNASTETDVYGLGVIILELLTGKSTREKLDWLVKPTKKETEFDLLSWVNSICMEDSFSEVFDPEVLKEEPGIEDVLINTLRIALRCLDSSPKGRPNAQQVLDSLDLRNC